MTTAYLYSNGSVGIDVTPSSHITIWGDRWVFYALANGKWRIIIYIGVEPIATAHVDKIKKGGK